MSPHCTASCTRLSSRLARHLVRKRALARAWSWRSHGTTQDIGKPRARMGAHVDMFSSIRLTCRRGTTHCVVAQSCRLRSGACTAPRIPCLIGMPLHITMVAGRQNPFPDLLWLFGQAWPAQGHDKQFGGGASPPNLALLGTINFGCTGTEEFPCSYARADLAAPQCCIIRTQIRLNHNKPAENHAPSNRNHKQNQSNTTRPPSGGPKTTNKNS